MPPASPQPPQPNQSPAPTVGGNYDFIMDPQKPPRRNPLFGLLGATSLATKLLYGAGGLLVLVIIITVIKGLFGGSSSLEPFVGIVQDQQAMIHLVDPDNNTGEQPIMSVADQNFAVTAQLSLTSSRMATVEYLSKNGRKVDVKLASMKISTATDQQLASAGSAGTYDQTFRKIMKERLTAYSQDLKQAYSQTKGPKGRALLNDSYDQAQLLLNQLNAAAAQPL